MCERAHPYTRTFAHYRFASAQSPAHYGAAMSLKALAVAALQQCAPRTIDRTLQENAPAHYAPEADEARTLENTDDAAEFWATLTARIDEADRLIHRLCDLRGDEPELRAELLATRKRIAPERLNSDIRYLREQVAKEQTTRLKGRGE